MTFKYLNQAAFHDHAWEIVQGEFRDRAAFDTWLAAIPEDEAKDRFLRAASFYKFLVLEGEYCLTSERAVSDPEYGSETCGYIDDTYKFIAIIAIIESLDDKPYRPFNEWLRARMIAGVAVGDAGALDAEYEAYASQYGLRQAVARFFGGLDEVSSAMLGAKLRISGKKKTIVRLGKLLYDIRSKFVHEAQFVLELGSGLHVSMHGDQVVESALTMEDLRRVFVRGLVAYFTSPLPVEHQV